MKNFDVIINGGGMVGLACALGLLKGLDDSEFKIAIIEPYLPDLSLNEDEYEIDKRVSALNISSQKILQSFGAWDLIERKACYDKMHVWEKDSFAKLDFDTEGQGVPYLGHIIENRLIRKALYQQLLNDKSGRISLFNNKAKQLQISDDFTLLTLDNDEILSAKLIVAADGANSWTRQALEIGINFRDYGHDAVVALVQSELAHNFIPQQVFTKDSIIGMLPLKSNKFYGEKSVKDENLSALVYSTEPDLALQFMQDKTLFTQQLNVNFDNHLGKLKLVSELGRFPLRARFARHFALNRAALIGDSAHSIHPLAGLGVNLGFIDSQILAEEIIKNFTAGKDIGLLVNLRNFERNRKLAATKVLTAMGSLKTIFSGDNIAKKLIRGFGVNLVNKQGFIKEFFIAQALGQEEKLPSFIQAEIDE